MSVSLHFYLDLSCMCPSQSRTLAVVYLIVELSKLLIYSSESDPCMHSLELSPEFHTQLCEISLELFFLHDLTISSWFEYPFLVFWPKTWGLSFLLLLCLFLYCTSTQGKGGGEGREERERERKKSNRYLSHSPFLWSERRIPCPGSCKCLSGHWCHHAAVVWSLESGLRENGEERTWFSPYSLWPLEFPFRPEREGFSWRSFFPHPTFELLFESRLGNTGKEKKSETRCQFSL